MPLSVCGTWWFLVNVAARVCSLEVWESPAVRGQEQEQRPELAQKISCWFEMTASYQLVVPEKPAEPENDVALWWQLPHVERTNVPQSFSPTLYPPSLSPSRLLPPNASVSCRRVWINFSRNELTRNRWSTYGKLMISIETLLFMGVFHFLLLPFSFELQWRCCSASHTHLHRLA